MEGADDEFIEVAMVNGYNLNQHRLTLYNGNGNQYEDLNMNNIRNDFTTNIRDGILYRKYVFGAVGSRDNIVNGIGGVAIVDIRNNGRVIEFLSYGGRITAQDGRANGERSTNIGKTQGPDNDDDDSISRIGTGYLGSDFRWEIRRFTPGDINIGQTNVCPSCPVCVTNIHDYVLLQNLIVF